MPQRLWSCAMKSNSEDSGDFIPSVNSLPKAGFLACGYNDGAPGLATGLLLAMGCHLLGMKSKVPIPLNMYRTAPCSLLRSGMDTQLNQT